MLNKIIKHKHLLLTLVFFMLAIGQVSIAYASGSYQQAKPDLGLIGSIFQLFEKQPFLLIFLSLALGYLIGRVQFKGIGLGSTAGSLLAAVILSLTAFLAYDIQYAIPGLLSTIFLSLFMFAIGLKVGPQFFSGLMRNGWSFVVMAVLVVVANFLIAWGGSRLVGLDPGFAAGIISGSFTVTAVVGVATGAVTSGAYALPQGMSAEQVQANIAAGYAISYVLSTVFIIVLVRYLPRLFGKDPVKAGKEAEELYGAGADATPMPGSDEAYVIGHLPVDHRAYRIEKEEFIGQSITAIEAKYSDLAILRLVRDGQPLDLEENPTLQRGDLITVFSELSLFVDPEQAPGSEVADPIALNVDLESADLVVSNKAYAGQTLNELGAKTPHGLYLTAIMRMGEQVPYLPDMVIERGDVLRVVGPKASIDGAAKMVGGVARYSADTEIVTLSIGLLIGFAVGLLSVQIGGISFGLGTSAGVMMAGIVIATLRTFNPTFGGPVPESARSLLQAIGLDLFVVVLGINVASKIPNSFQGSNVFWIVILGLLAALVPPLLAWMWGLYFYKMNPAILAGATAGARNSTPAMRAAQEEAQSNTPAIGYPVPYAVSSVLVLIAGYLAMIFS